MGLIDLVLALTPVSPARTDALNLHLAGPTPSMQSLALILAAVLATPIDHLPVSIYP